MSKTTEPITYEETIYIIYDWLTSIMEQEGLSQKRLAQISGYDQGNISRIISNVENDTLDRIKSVPASYALMRIASHVGYHLPNVDKSSISDIKKKIAHRKSKKN